METILYPPLQGRKEEEGQLLPSERVLELFRVCFFSTSFLILLSSTPSWSGMLLLPHLAATIAVGAVVFSDERVWTLGAFSLLSINYAFSPVFFYQYYYLMMLVSLLLSVEERCYLWRRTRELLLVHLAVVYYWRAIRGFHGPLLYQFWSGVETMLFLCLPFSSTPQLSMAMFLHHLSQLLLRRDPMALLLLLFTILALPHTLFIERFLLSPTRVAHLLKRRRKGRKVKKPEKSLRLVAFFLYHPRRTFILLFLLHQIWLPLDYYLYKNQDPREDRFLWYPTTELSHAHCEVNLSNTTLHMDRILPWQVRLLAISFCFKGKQQVHYNASCLSFETGMETMQILNCSF